MFILVDFSYRKMLQMFGSQATALFEEVPIVVLVLSEMSEVSLGALGEIIAFKAVILVLVFWCFSFASEFDLFSTGQGGSYQGCSLHESGVKHSTWFLPWE